MIILASQSQSRMAMLTAAGVRFEARPARIDERAVEAELKDAPPDQIARTLAEAKALAVTKAGETDSQIPVLGSDSLVVVGGKRFSKPGSRKEALNHLRYLSGRTMYLYSAAAIAKDGAVAWQHTQLATLQVRTLSDAFIDAYLDAEWPAVGQTVGVFRMEGLGVQLFERIDGDFFTILGMPLLAVLGALRDMKVLLA